MSEMQNSSLPKAGKKHTTTELFRMFTSSGGELKSSLATLETEYAPKLHEYLRKLLLRTNYTIMELSKEILANKSFIYQIFNGERIPGRDTLLRMAFVLKLSIDETEQLLKIAQRGSLYPRFRRDAILLYALHHAYTLQEADNALRQNGEQPLLEDE